MKKESLKDKVVIVTGARQGIGKSLATRFAQLGSKVVIVSRDSAGLGDVKSQLSKNGSEILDIPGDVSDEKSCEDIVNQTISKFGRIDILINNAGISGQGSVEKGKTIVFKRQIEVNLLGSFYMTKYSLPWLINSKGSVLFVSSLAAIYGIPAYSGYSASKMALTALAQSLKIELAGQDVHTGVAYVGFTDNDPKKEAYNQNGELEVLQKRKVKTVTSDKTAELIIKQILRRKFISVHSEIGKIQWIAAKFFPRLIEIILARAAENPKS
jgi:dehydrogenase/reductase SDR family protein 7B